MAVGTGNITLEEVTTEIYGDTDDGRSLSTCFSSATSGAFNPTYVGSKDRLSNFKGYVHADNGVWGVDDMTSLTQITNYC